MTEKVSVRKHTRRRTGHTAQLAERLGFDPVVEVDTYARRRPAMGKWYLDGFEEGKFAAEVNLAEPGGREELREAMMEDRLGEIAGQIREHQVQMAGDISYDIERPGGPTELQYERWESGFYEGFEKGIREALRPRRPRK